MGCVGHEDEVAIVENITSLFSAFFQIFYTTSAKNRYVGRSLKIAAQRHRTAPWCQDMVQNTWCAITTKSNHSCNLAQNSWFRFEPFWTELLMSTTQFFLILHMLHIIDFFFFHQKEIHSKRDLTWKLDIIYKNGKSWKVQAEVNVLHWLSLYSTVK